MSSRNKTDNLNIVSFKPLMTPQQIKRLVPMPSDSTGSVLTSRAAIASILERNDHRKIIIVGPCSIHDPKSALEYATRLKALSDEVADSMLLVMRAYFEKPRTTVGWKGLINDPNLDNSFAINEGVTLARQLLVTITSMGLPVATEALDPIMPQYFAEFISWTAIGARTTESQTHRELASGLSSPVGFKNNTDGNIEVAINAIKSARQPHHFLGIDQAGLTSVVATSGNPYGHLILRGGKAGHNYDVESVKRAAVALKDAQLMDNIVIDCSHDNSNKDYRNQAQVFTTCIDNIVAGQSNIVGLMLESHLNEGQQKLVPQLEYGVSITDGCIGFDTTAEIIKEAHIRLLKRVF